MRLKFRSEKSARPIGTEDPITVNNGELAAGIKSARLLHCGRQEIAPCISELCDSWVTEHIGFTLWLTYYETDFLYG